MEGTFSTGGADECSVCTEGTTSEMGAAGCSTCSTCSTGRYMINTCTPTADTQCKDCLAGTVSMGGDATECTSCTKRGEYSDSDKASACKTAAAGTKPSADRTTIETCPENTYSIGASDTCTLCPDGGHSLPGSSACDWCLKGKYYKKTTNTCEACPNGKYTDTGEIDINNCKDCAPGFYSNDPEGAGYCSPCPAGSYTNSNQTGCPARPTSLRQIQL